MMRESHQPHLQDHQHHPDHPAHLPSLQKLSSTSKNPPLGTISMGTLVRCTVREEVPPGKLVRLGGVSPRSRSKVGSSSVVIYRSAKYNGVFGRCQAYLRTYANLLIPHQSLVPLMRDCHNYLLESLGFLYLLIMTPLHIFIALLLFLLRQSRLFLVKKYYPSALVCEDFSPRCVFGGKSVGVVTCVLWIKGRIDSKKLRTYFEAKSSPAFSPILRRRITSQFGLRLFSNPKTPFDVSKHVVDAPKKYLKYFVSEAPLHGGKSALEQFVSVCASEFLDPERPPWKLTVIPLPVLNKNKEKTCVVLRIHYFMLNHPQVEQLLEHLFNQPLYRDSRLFRLENGSGEGTVSVRSEVYINFLNKPVRDVALQVEPEEEMAIDFQLPFLHIKEWALTAWENLVRFWFQTICTSVSDLKAWLNLHKKLLDFHPRSVVLKHMTYETSNYFQNLLNSTHNFRQSQQWAKLKFTLLQALFILRAVAFVPMEVISVFLHTYPRGGNGFRKFEREEARRIAWSSPISTQLVEAIKSRTGVSTQSIALTACALALKDYYAETSIGNPKSLDILAPIVTKNLLAPTGYYSLTLRTDNISVPQQLQRIEKEFKEKSAWEILGHYLIIRYISYVLPRALAYRILEKMFSRYPITFTQINMQSPSSIVVLPHISVWGQTVDEFMYWRPPQSDMSVCISLINYSEVMRLSVLSPMKSLDTALTQRFSQNLNRIAEEVGVERNLIPYSRRSSPISSNCASPSGFRKL